MSVQLVFYYSLATYFPSVYRSRTYPMHSFHLLFVYEGFVVFSIECHNAFKLDLLKTYTDEGYTVALFKVQGDIKNCATPIAIGTSLEQNLPFFAIGSPQQNGRSLLWQPLIMAPLENCSDIDQSVSRGQTICMKRFGTCPLNPGDLLVQNDHLHGLALSKTIATTSKSQTVMSYFAKIGFISELLKIVKMF